MDPSFSIRYCRSNYYYRIEEEEEEKKKSVRSLTVIILKFCYVFFLNISLLRIYYIETQLLTNYIKNNIKKYITYLLNSIVKFRRGNHLILYIYMNDSVCKEKKD